MASLREVVRLVRSTPGVMGAAAAGRDGLLIDADGLDAATADHVAALAPGLTASAEMLADAAGSGEVRAVALEGDRGLVLAMPLSRDVTLVALVDGADDAAGDALYALRRARADYASRI